MSKNTSVFEYQYRDGGNFKTCGFLLLSGQDEHAEAAIRQCLEWGDQFVAEQIGVPALYEKHWRQVEDGPSDLDHSFHEFVCLRAAQSKDQDLPLWGTLADMLKRMLAASGRWDVRHSPNCDL